MAADLNLLTTQATGSVVYGIDASSANKEKRTGVENYARELIQALKLQPLKQHERVVLFSPTKLDEELGTLPDGWTSQILKWPLKRGWMSCRVSWEMLRRRPSVLFVPSQSLSPLAKGGSRGVLPEIAYASGAAVLYRASVLQKVGLLDSYLFLYHEDLELGWRLRLAGFKNVLCIDSVAYHDYEFKRSIKKFYWMERNRVLVHFSHLTCKTLVLLAIPMLLAEFGLIVFAIKGGWIREKFLVYVSLLSPRSWNYVKTKRRESKLLRRVSDREIVRLWTGKIEHQETQSFIVDRLVNPILSFLWTIIKFFVPST